MRRQQRPTSRKQRHSSRSAARVQSARRGRLGLRARTDTTDRMGQRDTPGKRVRMRRRNRRADTRRNRALTAQPPLLVPPVGLDPRDLRDRRDFLDNPESPERPGRRDLPDSQDHRAEPDSRDRRDRGVRMEHFRMSPEFRGRPDPPARQGHRARAGNPVRAGKAIQGSQDRQEKLARRVPLGIRASQGKKERMAIPAEREDAITAPRPGRPPATDGRERRTRQVPNQCAQLAKCVQKPANQTMLKPNPKSKRICTRQAMPANCQISHKFPATPLFVMYLSNSLYLPNFSMHFAKKFIR